MKSVNSEENKSISGTSESERLNFNFKLKSYKYQIMPKRNYNLRHSQNSQEKLISTNLFEIKFIDEYHKFTLFSSEILPEIALDNFSLRRQIYTKITLPSSFKKFFWAWNNLYAFIVEDERKNNNYNNIEITEEINIKIYNKNELLRPKTNRNCKGVYNNASFTQRQKIYKAKSTERKK